MNDTLIAEVRIDYTAKEEILLVCNITCINKGVVSAIRSNFDNRSWCYEPTRQLECNSSWQEENKKKIPFHSHYKRIPRVWILHDQIKCAKFFHKAMLLNFGRLVQSLANQSLGLRSDLSLLQRSEPFNPGLPTVFAEASPSRGVLEYRQAPSRPRHLPVKLLPFFAEF